ncbi:hypothetical protein BKA60DRAFT_566595 [Fusarium oxysporum]|nr:hypothetical protein BKA60DRAFT_566595 [Fusarium oxysporum]
MFLFAMDTTVLLSTTVVDLSLVATTATGTRLLKESLTVALSPAPTAVPAPVPALVLTKVPTAPMVAVPRTRNPASYLLSAGLVSRLLVYFPFLLQLQPFFGHVSLHL